MDFRILGPLEIADDGRPVAVEGHKPRALLAILLVHANEVVPPDRLIDELWGEAPPPTASKTLQAHISRLRKSLDGTLETRGRGYVLRVEPGRLDAHAFEELLEQGRRQLAGGHPAAAHDSLEQALGLWRGPALADFAYEPFAQAEIARLDELQRGALEERVEADLQLGRHAELLGELRSLVARHPLRERLRAQLMLALYRSDRQAEALQVHQDGRRVLLEELGAEPSENLRELERRILNHDPALAAPSRPDAASRLAAHARPRTTALVAAVVAVTVAATLAAALAGGGDEPEPAAGGAARAEGGSVRLLDPRTGTPTGTVPLGRSPANVAVGGGSVWVIDADDRTVSRIDPTGRKSARTFSTASTPTDIAVGAGAVWIGNASPDAGFASYPGSVSRLDPVSGVVETTIKLPRKGGTYYQGGGISAQFIAVTPDAVWVVNPDQTVSRIDPGTNRVVARIRGVVASAIAAGDGRVWLVDDDGVAEIDPTTNRVARRIPVAADGLTALAVAEGSIWAADPFGGSVWRIDPDPEVRQRTIPVDFGVNAVAVGAGAVWASNEIADQVHRIDPATNEASRLAPVAAPGGVGVGPDAVWVSSRGPTSAAGDLPDPPCGPLAFPGGGKPDLRIVSDLPMQGENRPITAAMTRAIRLVLERRGFRSGSRTVGYQPCDDSTAQAGGTDAFRCFSNAKLYAQKLDVAGVIGSFHSFCSDLQIPIANQAPGGPLAMISPSNTVAGLTREWERGSREELERLYPTGRRNYVRVIAADHLAAVALARVAKLQRARSVFIAWDGDDSDSEATAAATRRAAEAAGLRIAGTAGWNPRGGDFDRFARRIASGGAGAVVLAGAAPPGVGELLRDLRARLGAGTPLVASDGFAGFEEVVREAGRAADGLYVTNAGLPAERLSREGRRLLKPNYRGPDGYFIHAAQAAEVLLDAIERSDGTRGSITEELLRTRIDDGLIGDVSFDRNGDVVRGPVTVFRIAGRRPVVDRVLNVSAQRE